MEDRKEYQGNMEKQLQEWGAKIDDLQARAEKASRDAKDDLNQRIDALKSKRDDVQKRLSDLKSASDDAWSSLKSGFQNAWNEFSSSVEEAKSKFD
ncbi:hypothetical protein NEA10_19610 [Phormidium yuhuli AB48]|uniref:Coiled coil domain-containing protein n=1 Tax=Phormidium yuhuli AB48 TaxID=2940671 RepID=A0ABY5AP64_9CYAN|nr:hypothetical protein [Phormidium yuhuli]USR91002.1 hypothetical protein NEA10_19610 [Phormidium yuhuli AB48]